MNLDILKRATELAKPATDAIAKNSPHILIGAGVAGFVATVALAIKATPTAADIHEDYEGERLNQKSHHKMGRIDDEDLKRFTRESYVEEAKELAPVYLPTVLMGSASIACVLVGHRIQVKRGAAVLAAYSLAERTLETYQDKVIERLGEDGARELKQEVSNQLAVDDCPFDADYSYLPDGEGNVLCYDRVTGKFFKSTKERIREAEAAVNKRLIDEATVRLGDFYYELGIEDHSFVADAVGWDLGKCKPDVYFTSMLDDKERPCLVLNYDVCLVDPRIIDKRR